MSEDTVFKTERQRVRTAAAADAELLHRRWTDPLVMRFVYSCVYRVHREDWKSGS